jgi:hypothetical protein
LRVGDTLKAVGLAALILALNLLATTVAVPLYDWGFGAEEPSRIAAWSAPIGGAVLFLLAMSFLGRRRPQRNPWSFALRTWIAYVILDAASGLAIDPHDLVVSWGLTTLSMVLALAGAMAGATLARPRRATVAARP